MEAKGSNKMSDEQFLIAMTRRSLATDPLESKVWMLTAKTLFPGKFGIQFEAYKIEKLSRNAKEASKYFSALYRKFRNNERLWKEVLSMMSALRSNTPDKEQTFLNDMFSHIPPQIQYELLLVTANRSQDTIDQCHLMILLLRTFPNSMEKHGAKLVDSLMTAEKCSFDQKPLNSFRKLLVCDMLPLVADCTSINWTQKQLYKLLLLSIEFYICYIRSLATNNMQEFPDTGSVIEDPWKNLFRIYEIIGTKLNWELTEMFSSYPLNKETSWQKIYKFTNSSREKDQYYLQLVYCALALYIYSLYDYNAHLDPDSAALQGENENNLVFVETVPHEKVKSLHESEKKVDKTGCNFEHSSFAYDGRNSNLNTGLTHEPPSKIRKIDSPFENTNVVISDRGNSSSPVIDNFLLAYKLYKLFHSIDIVEREFLTLSQILKLDKLLKEFHIDLAIYQGLYHECAKMLGTMEPSLKKNIRMACTNFFLKDYEAMYKDILSVVSQLSSFSSTGEITPNPSNSNGGKCMTFIPFKKLPILQYCCKLLITTLKMCLDSTCVESDLACGHIIVLAQLSWPQEEKIFDEIIEKIKLRGSWSYALFTKYITLVDFLEEFMFLSTERGGALNLDIFSLTSSQIPNPRRMSTRGVDKVTKEDFKVAMRKQVGRNQERYDAIISTFLSTEKDLISHTHV